MGDKTQSSSAMGHIIVAHLRDSTYKMSIGFPNNQFPEQEYNIQLNKRDRGFELKNLPEKGWSLFDLTSMELISPVKPAGSNGGSGGVAFIKRNDAFARLMSGVVNDTAVLYVAAVEKKPVPAVVKKVNADASDLAKDSKKADTDSGVTGVAKKESVTTTADSQKKADEKVNEQNNVAKKTENNAVDPAKKIETVAIDPNKKTESTSVDSVKKTEVVTPDLTNTKKTDSQTSDVANNSKKTDPSASELSKASDTAKKVNPDPTNEPVFNPPALPVITVVKQYVTDSGYHMVMMDDKDSVSIFIPGDAKEVSETPKQDVAKDEKQVTTTEKVKKWFKNLVGKKPAADKNEDKPASNPVQENKTVPTQDKTNNENKPVIADSSKSVNEDTKSVNQNKPLTSDKVNSENKPANTDKPSEVKTPEKKLSDQNASPAKENAAVSKPDANQKTGDDSAQKSTKLVMINSDCRAVATSSDLDKLRVKLVQEKDAESRIAAARKVFKTKCFTAAQIKALSELFPYDEQKYQFLEAAYPFVSDTFAFKELVTLLDDPNYISRFRRLVRLD